MATKELLTPTELSRPRAVSRPDELEKWAEFLRPPELDLYRAVRDAIAMTLAQKSSPLRELTRKWTDDEFMDYALKAVYPADIEERIEESWRR